jgi:hypothetical protein
VSQREFVIYFYEGNDSEERLSLFCEIERSEGLRFELFGGNYDIVDIVNGM